MFVFFFQQKTAYEMRICDWSSDVCSSDLAGLADPADRSQSFVSSTPVPSPRRCRSTHLRGSPASCGSGLRPKQKTGAEAPTVSESGASVFRFARVRGSPLRLCFSHDRAKETPRKSRVRSNERSAGKEWVRPWK